MAARESMGDAARDRCQLQLEITKLWLMVISTASLLYSKSAAEILLLVEEPKIPSLKK
jgi:hypothetical protein